MPQSVLGLAPSLGETGKRLIDAGELYALLQLLLGTQAGVVGAASAPGPLMNMAVNEVASGANVSLPMALAGQQITIINGSASGITVNAQVSNPNNGGAADVINNAAASVTQATGTSALYICYRVGWWSQVAPAAAPVMTSLDLVTHHDAGPTGTGGAGGSNNVTPTGAAPHQGVRPTR